MSASGTWQLESVVNERECFRKNMLLKQSRSRKGIFSNSAVGMIKRDAWMLTHAPLGYSAERALLAGVGSVPPIFRPVSAPPPPCGTREPMAVVRCAIRLSRQSKAPNG